jgi:hypothetical protein
MTTTIKRTTLEIAPSIWKDNASSNYGPNDDGLSFCGARTYTMTAPGTIPSWFTLTGNDTTKNRVINSPNLTNTDKVLSPGTNYTIRVCLSKYTDICLDKTFKVIINPCVITSYGVTSGAIPATTYIPWSSSVNTALNQLVWSQVPSCGYTSTLSMSQSIEGGAYTAI